METSLEKEQVSNENKLSNVEQNVEENGFEERIEEQNNEEQTEDKQEEQIVPQTLTQEEQGALEQTQGLINDKNEIQSNEMVPPTLTNAEIKEVKKLKMVKPLKMIYKAKISMEKSK